MPLPEPKFSGYALLSFAKSCQSFAEGLGLAGISLSITRRDFHVTDSLWYYTVRPTKSRSDWCTHNKSLQIAETYLAVHNDENASTKPVPRTWKYKVGDAVITPDIAWTGVCLVKLLNDSSATENHYCLHSPICPSRSLLYKENELSPAADCLKDGVR